MLRLLHKSAKADISLFPITNLKFPAHGIKFPVKFLGKSMKNYVVSGGYMRRIPINAIKNEKFPVNSLFFREFRSETGYWKTASTTTHPRYFRDNSLARINALVSVA